MSGEYENDVYTVRIRLNYLIPEFLPIRSKRARIYYHGIAPFCNLCYSPGHHRQECGNNPISWSEYVEALKDTGIPLHLFDPLDNSLNLQNTANSSNSFNLTSTPIGQASLAVLRSLLQESIANASSQAPPVVPPQAPPNPNLARINPIPRMVTRRQSTNDEVQILEGPSRGRGRARGRGASSSSSASNNSLNPNPEPIGAGRGRGRGRQPPDQFYFPAPRPRGRGAQYSFWGNKRPQ
jgi:hypothetical protein